jgi:hypothetical protein
MAKSLSDATLDGLLDKIALATILCVCNAEPTTYTELTSTFKLADVVVDSGDFTKANGDTNGRKVTVGAQSAVTIDTSGTATHVGFGTTSGSVFIGTTTCTSQALTAAGTVDIPAFKIEVADPT